jgi:hypothetical protein
LVTVNVYGIVAPSAVKPVAVVFLSIFKEEGSGVLVSVQVMSSLEAGRIENGTAVEPAAGRTVADPAFALTHVTVDPYWLSVEVEPAAIASLKLYTEPAVAEATVTTPLLALIVEPVPAVVAVDPLGADPLGLIAIVN